MAAPRIVFEQLETRNTQHYVRDRTP